MKVRKRVLPEGWYPATEYEAARQLDLWKLRPGGAGTGLAGVVPHAGWYFSGILAADVIRQMSGDADTVVVAGGHLPPGAPLTLALEEGFQVPGDFLEADRILVEQIRNEMTAVADKYRDNTVEIQLPFVKRRWPRAKTLWIRVPPDSTAVELADLIFDYERKSDKKVVVIGSTDLTHYGPNYGFSPAGSGAEALHWVKEVNDAGILDAMTRMDVESILKQGNENKAACSSGAAAFAAAWASLKGVRRGRRVDYYTSADVMPGESFVGYGGILYEPD